MLGIGGNPRSLLVSCWRRVIARRVPHTLISWRFLFPCRGAVQLHRRIFLGAWPTLPRWAYSGLLLWSLCTWFGFWGWYLLVVGFQRNAKALTQETGLSGWQQGKALLRLMGRGVPAGWFYRYRLYRHAPEAWWLFVFDHELPHWHGVLQQAPSRTTRQVLTDKRRFSQLMAAHRLPAVGHDAVWPKGSTPVVEALSGPCFLKPVSASGGLGCFRYAPAAGGQPATLIGEGGEVSGEVAIRRKLSELSKRYDMLVQPLLANHRDIAASVQTPAACTVRIVTLCDRLGIRPLRAVFEEPLDGSRRVNTGLIDPASGRLLPPHPGGLKGMPCWSELVDLVCRAHALIPDLSTIGWDVVVTDGGPVLLEGNINWRVSSIQIAAQAPLLERDLMEVYSEQRQ